LEPSLPRSECSMERKFHGSESSLYGLFAPRNESAEERKGLESGQVFTMGQIFVIITRSHGSSVTSVVIATRQVSGRRQTYPSHHTHTPQPTVAKYCTRDYVHDRPLFPHKRHLVKIAPGVTSVLGNLKILKRAG